MCVIVFELMNVGKEGIGGYCGMVEGVEAYLLQRKEKEKEKKT